MNISYDRQEVIDRVLEDIKRLKDKNAPVIVSFDIENGVAKDYELAKVPGTLPGTTLVNVLAEFIMLNSIVNTTPIGAFLKAHRLAEGMTQDSTAAASGINIRLLQKYESGFCAPKITAAVKLSQILKFDLTEYTNHLLTGGQNGA